MPELPEIETVRRSLQPLVSRHIQSIYFSRLAPVETTTTTRLRQALLGGKLSRVSRWGKYLLFDTDSGNTLVIHLGMSGQVLFYDGSIPTRTTHTHLELVFKDKSLLRFIDARRFGTISLSDLHRADNPFLKRLGPDYLDLQMDEAGYIERCRRHPKLTLKMLLLNQGVAAGMGNIYACEALFLAGLDPRRRVQDVGDVELGELLLAARKSLGLGIRHGGTSFRDYLDGRGHRGKMQEFLQVYDREGQGTLDGRGRVIKLVQQARSTYYCPEVQK